MAAYAPQRPVFLARDDDPTDAAVAGPVAAQLGGVVLLTPTGGLGTDAEQGIVSFLPDLVVLVGGTTALSEQVRADAEALLDPPNEELSYAVLRVGGVDRRETARLLADLLLSRPPAYQRADAAACRAAFSAETSALDLEGVDAATVLETAILAPAPGLLLVNGGSDFLGHSPVSGGCLLTVDGEQVPGSTRGHHADSEFPEVLGGAETSGAVAVEAGPHAAALVINSDGAKASSLRRHLSVQYVPHGGS
jgi:hypothetical protein